MNKIQAKDEIKKLVTKYEQVKISGKIKSYTEEETKNSFIKPLFEILGWNFSSKEEVSAEESILSSGRVDFGFYINGRAKLYLEAKPLKADLNNEDYARQAIRYSWNRDVTWAVLTDFEGLKVFNAKAASKYLGDKLFFSINYDEYLERFEQLWLLSKESFSNDLLDKEAEKVGKKIIKTPITDSLYKDLNKCREILTHDLNVMNEGIDRELLDEGVQRLLDRLIFIRVAEDRGIESSTLIPLLRSWENSDGKKPLYAFMVSKFRELDKVYNSNLFSSHPFEEWVDYGDSTKKVIKILYGTEGYNEYDFKVIPADVLGSVYENYLGYKLSQSQKGLSLDKASGKRKEQGIYYTPTFIVDYIVRNALKPVLDKCVSVNDLKRVKVLDPACGSGSFLVKALEVIVEKYNSFNYGDSENLRKQIILENLYGVDLDEQAVELAKLNLLINALKEQGVLPSLNENIKNGNSLISGTDQELEKYFGKNFRDKKPFNWKEEFPEVFKQGGFNAIIGNPPYEVLGSEDEELNYFKQKYINTKGGKSNLYKLFLEVCLNDLLRESGYLGFICPSNYLSSADSLNLRKELLENTDLIEIVEYEESDKVFKGVTQSLTTIIFKKSINQLHENEIHIITKKHGNITVKQNLFLKNKKLEFTVVNDLISKIQENNSCLSNLADFYQGEVNVSTKKNYFTFSKSEDNLPLLRGNLINRYFVTEAKEFCPISIVARNDFLKKRIVFQEVSNQQQKMRVKASIVENVMCGHTTNYCVPKQKSDIYLLLALLNSRLLNYYFSYFNHTNHIPVGEIKNIPISKNVNGQKEISALVLNRVNLTRSNLTNEENSNKWNDIKSEIEKTDKKIDEEIYKLYGLTQEEIGIVESS